mgnify:FL=1
MDEILNNQENLDYATPFNVDFSGPKSKNFFTEYTARVLSLPESIRNILMDSSTAEFIEDNLGPNFDLSRVQITEITRIIRDVLLGEFSVNNMALVISRNLKIDLTVANQIQSKVTNDLFGPVIEDIKNLQTQKPQEREYGMVVPPILQVPRTPDKPDLKIDPSINRNNIVDLRNK